MKKPKSNNEKTPNAERHSAPSSTAASSLARRMAQDPSPATHTPPAPSPPDRGPDPALTQNNSAETPAKRPKPAPKAAHQAKDNPRRKAAKSKTPANKRAAQADPAEQRQKKMAILVGVLSIIFAAVLVISLGGVGQSQKSASPKDQDNDETAAPVTAALDLASWPLPESIPPQIRDPLTVPKQNSPDDDTEPVEVEQAAPLIIRGIVYSSTRPAAIIGDHIVFQGQSIKDATIVAITRQSVEFERDGKRWTQGVQPDQ